MVGKAKGGRLIVPTPAYAEATVRMDAAVAVRHLQIFERLRGLRVADFDKLAAIEFADMQRQMLADLPRRARKVEAGSRARAKFDQQILAIAKVERAQFIVTDDDGLTKLARRFGLEAKSVGDLSVPPVEDGQGLLALEPPEEPAPPDEGDA